MADGPRHSPADAGAPDAPVAAPPLGACPNPAAWPNPAADTPLAEHLRPILEHALESAIGEPVEDIAFFRGPWQRGGAPAARVRLSTRELVVKLPTGATELHWFRRLGERGDSVARLLASGTHLGPYGLAWIALERLPHGSNVRGIGPSDIERLAAASARLAHAMRGCAAAEHPHAEVEPHRAEREALVHSTSETRGARGDWPAQLAAAAEAIARAAPPCGATSRDGDVAGPRAWLALLDQVARDLPTLLAHWNARAPREWIHGELHPRHALARSPWPSAPLILADLAHVRRGHWVEDAVQLERLFWTRPDLLRAARPVRAMAQARRALGLPLDARGTGDAAGEPNDSNDPIAPVERQPPADHAGAVDHAAAVDHADAVDHAATADWKRLVRIRRVLLAATAPTIATEWSSPAYRAACLGQLERNLRELGALPPAARAAPRRPTALAAVEIETTRGIAVPASRASPAEPVEPAEPANVPAEPPRA